jgi:5-methylcytosine-specific restriction enzyme A
VAEIWKFCAEPGCTGLAKGSRFCGKHQESNYEKRRESQRSPFDRFYRTAIWRNRLRPMKLRRDPMCQDCGVKPATDVHHEDDSWKETGNWTLFVTFELLRSLCHECHSRRTMAATRKGAL